jgi:hypothetical protein
VSIVTGDENTWTYGAVLWPPAYTANFPMIVDNDSADHGEVGRRDDKSVQVNQRAAALPEKSMQISFEKRKRNANHLIARVDAE